MAPEHQEVPNAALPVPGDDDKNTFQSIVVRASETSGSNALKQSRMRSKAILSHVSAAVA